jgi:hypothetical protein
MKLAKIAVILALPLALSGCQAMIWGQLSAVFASALIFAGTLALGRATDSRVEKVRESGTSSTTLH